MDKDRIIARNLQFSYMNQKEDSHPVLEDVSFSINRGQIVAIAGTNGIGKSTLLKILCGSMQANKGSLHIFGHPAGEVKIGFVWQQTYASLYPWLTALDNAAVPLRLKGLKKKQRRERIKVMCKELDFDLSLDTYPFELSGGDQQKVCILRALASDCDLLLLDEPTSNLSFENALEVLLYLQNIHEHTNLTTILVSHSPEFSIFVADNIIPLSRKPLRLSEDDKIKIQCKYPRSRPKRWMYDTEFQDQVELLKNKIEIKKNE